MNRISLSLASTLLGCSMALATTPDQWTMWVEGDPPPWDALNDWVLNGQDAKLPTGHLVIRLIDPLAPSDQGADYKLPTSPDDELPPSLAFIKNLRNSFDGQISVLPYFDSNTSGWIWDDNTPSMDQWFRPMQWTIKANEALAARGVSNGINAINYENFDSDSFIQIDDATLLSWQNHLLTIWPQWDQSSGFIGMIISKDNNSLTNMVRYTTSTTGPYPDYQTDYFQYPPLVGGMAECYQMYKSCTDYAGGHHTVVDVSNVAHSPQWYPPYSGEQIYQSSGNSADPVSTLLGTPTAICPNPTLSPPEPSTIGFLVGVHATPCDGSPGPDCMTGADLSKVTLLFSNDGGTSGKIFGYWDGIKTPATVDTFKSFVGAFDDAFDSYWQPASMPQYGIWDFGLMPASWKGSAASCPGDLSGNSQVDVEDVIAMLDVFGTPEGEVNGDGQPDIEDLLHILDHYGRICH